MEVSSPPYPARASTVQSLYRACAELHAWAKEFIPDAHVDTGGKCPGITLKPMASKEKFENLAVACQYGALVFVRAAREHWDQIVRTYEGDWGSKAAFMARHAYAHNLANFFENGFETHEVLEMKMQRDMDSYLVNVQREIARLFGHAPEADDEEEEEDDES